MKISHILSILIAHCCIKKEQIEVNGASRPNIVIILADDVGTGEVPGYWDTGKVDMPHLQSLVDMGTVFTDVHSTPLCAPSRYVLLSGNYQHRGSLYGGTWQVNHVAGQFRDGQQSIASVLRSNNYHTSMTGKWHLGGKAPTVTGYTPTNNVYVKPINVLSNNDLNWTKPLEKGSPQDLGFESSLMSLGGIQGGPYKFLRDGKFEDLSKIVTWDTGTYSMPAGSSIIRRESEGSPDWDSAAFNMIQVNETARFLDDHIQNRKDDPFFAYIALGTVHVPHSPPTVYLDGTPVAGQYNTSHMDVLGEMDKIVGSVVQHLEDRQLLKDTIVIFASDNGGMGPKHSGEFGHNGSGPLRGSKGQIYEGGHRIPMIMRWDNGPIPAGETRSHLIGLNDLFATISQFAGAEIPEGQAIDSVSFANYIENEANTANLRKHQGAWTIKNGKIREESIRQDSMKLIRSRITGEMFLYDLDTDISETTNLINNGIYKDTVSEMMVKLKEISPCYDNQGTFDIVKGETTEQTTCAWFRQQPRRRCEAHYEGQIECRLTCAGRSKTACLGVPSSKIPTSSPVGQNKISPESRAMPTISTAPSSRDSGDSGDSTLKMETS